MNQSITIHKPQRQKIPQGKANLWEAPAISGANTTTAVRNQQTETSEK